MRRPIIAANWKMNKLSHEARELAREVVEGTRGLESLDVVLIPPFTALAAVAPLLNGTNVSLGAQDCFWEEWGAFTGEVSPRMLIDSDCRFVLVGHSERRGVLGETDQMINRKLKAALASGLKVILCIGERLEERDSGKTLEVLEHQLTLALSGLEAPALEDLVIAYEPVWAIGTGRAASAEQAQHAQGFIRGLIRESYGRERAENLRIQYGGSVTPENIASFISQPDVDGALVGGASLKASVFLDLLYVSDKIVQEFQ
ncbi:MAG: triose-phosphate isomerase [Nitrospinota bacterium]